MIRNFFQKNKTGIIIFLCAVYSNPPVWSMDPDLKGEQKKSPIIIQKNETNKNNTLPDENKDKATNNIAGARKYDQAFDLLDGGQTLFSLGSFGLRDCA